MRTIQAEVANASDEELDRLLAGTGHHVLRQPAEREAAAMEKERRRLAAAQQERIGEELDRLRRLREEARRPRQQRSPIDEPVSVLGHVLNDVDRARLLDLITAVARKEFYALLDECFPLITSVSTEIVTRGHEEEDEEE